MKTGKTKINQYTLSRFFNITPMSVNFSSIIIGTRDIESAKEFYVNVFGFVISTQSEYYLSGYI